MKKLLAIIILASFLLWCCACSAQSAQNDLSSNSEIASTASSDTADNEANNTSSDIAESSNGESSKIEVDENLLTVEITIPPFSEEPDPDFDPEKYIKENGFISAKQNEDGSITVKMTKAKHKEFLKKAASDLNSALAEIAEDQSYSYVKEIKANSDFSKFNIYVDREEYESNIDLLHLVLGAIGTFYQQIAGIEDAKSQINIIDQSTGEEITTFDFPIE